MKGVQLGIGGEKWVSHYVEWISLRLNWLIKLVALMMSNYLLGLVTKRVTNGGS